MNCSFIRQEHLAEQYLLGTLTGNRLDAYEQHYFQCDSCFEDLRQLDEIRQTLIAAPVIAPRPGFPQSLAGSRWQWPAFAAVAASLAFAALLLGDYRPVAGPAGIDPAAIHTRSVGAQHPAESRSNRSLALARLAMAQPPPYVQRTMRGPGEGLSGSFRQGMIAYTDGRYQAAADELRKAASANSARADIAFFLAASELFAGNPLAARAGFEAVLTMGETAFTDEAYFYLAKAQLALNDPDAARHSLQRISQSNAALRAEADRLSRQLDGLPDY